MGHKFSDLKRFYGSMENKQKNLNVKSNNNQIDNTIGMINKLEMSDQNESSSSSCENNGNGVDKHFENIYSNGAESLKLQEENGNVLAGPESSNCSCSKSADDVTEEAKSSRRTSSSKSLSFVSGKRSRTKTVRSPKETGTKKKKNNWVLKFNCARLKSNGACSSSVTETDIPESNVTCDSCVCTGYRRTEEHHLGAGIVFDSIHPGPSTSAEAESVEEIPSHQQQQQIVVIQQAPLTLAEQMIDMSRFNPDDYPTEDCDERARQERAREIAEGVDPPPGFLPGQQHIQLLCPPDLTLDNLTALFQTHLGIHSATAALSALSQLDASLTANGPNGAHTQVDYIHCLVPDLLQITSCSFYWGKMDRYEAERLLEGRPEGTFLLRDSAQEEYLFSVSFRKYGRSLHARIEQWNHNFSFDSHDPGVFASPTVCGLIEHYKDPSCCMFFEPMLTIPLHRNFTFPLQHLCRAVICNRSNYDSINKLQLPKTLKCYLKEYHYKQRIRVRDLEHQSRS